MTVFRVTWIEGATFTALRYGLKVTCDGHSGYHTIVTTRLYLWTGNSGAGLTSDNYRKLVKPDGWVEQEAEE